MYTILIIDDEKDIVDMLAEFFTARGFAVVTACDGEDGVKKFDSERPDIVMCDIKMPRKDGFEFLKEIRAMRKWVPVIIVSALSEPANVMKGYRFEADYYIPKPINLEATLKVVQMMISLIPLRKK